MINKLYHLLKYYPYHGNIEKQKKFIYKVYTDTAKILLEIAKILLNLCSDEKKSPIISPKNKEVRKTSQNIRVSTREHARASTTELTRASTREPTRASQNRIAPIKTSLNIIAPRKTSQYRVTRKTSQYKKAPKMKAYKNIFLPVAENIKQDMHRGKRYGRLHLPDTLKGSNSFLTDRVEGLI